MNNKVVSFTSTFIKTGTSLWIFNKFILTFFKL